MTRAVIVASVVIAAACVAGALAIIAVSFGVAAPDSWGFRGFPALFAFTFTWAGANLAWRRPQNRISWLLLWVGVVSATQALLSEYSLYGIVGRPAALPGAVFAGWLVSWVWLTVAVLVSVFLLLLFPDGHTVSPRWRIFGWLGGLSAGAGALALAFTSGPLNNAPYAENPYGLVADPDVTLFYRCMIGVGIASAGAAASLVVRYRRSRGVERQQLKWLALEAVLIVIAVFVGSFDQADKWASVFLIGAIALAPVMVGVAVVRYHLYDVDVVINRAIVYGLTVAAIGVTFFAGIVVLQTALRPLTGGSEIAVAASTLLSVALFQPVGRRVRSAVDQRFYRSRYDASRTLDAFTDRLREEVDLDAVRADLVDAVRDTVQPAHASLWLRERVR